MIQVISSYIKNIAMFIIFMTMVELILPDSKYKAYINLVLGFVIIFIMLQPVEGLLRKVNAKSYKNPFDMSVEFDKRIMQKEQEYYNNDQKEIILKNYKSQIVKQLENLVDNSGEFHFANAEIVVSENQEDFGNLQEINLTVTKAEKKKAFIRVEKVKISKEPEEESQVTKNLKILISDFYNLSDQNIYITIQKKRG